MNSFKGNGVVKNFYDKATIQVKSKFLVTFTDDTTDNQEKKDLYEIIGNMPKIDPWQVKQIEYPYMPSIDVVDYYFQTIPVVDPYKPSANTISIQFIENEFNNVLQFGEWLFRKISGPSGILRSSKANFIDQIDIYEINIKGEIINHEVLTHCLFTKMDGNSRSSDGGIIERTLEFTYIERLREDRPLSITDPSKI